MGPHLLLFTPLRTTVLEPYLNSSFGEADFQSEFFSRKYIRIMCPSKRLLQFIKLVTGEGSPVPPLFPLRNVLVIQAAARPWPLVFHGRKVRSGGGTRLRHTHNEVREVENDEVVRIEFTLNSH